MKKKSKSVGFGGQFIRLITLVVMLAVLVGVLYAASQISLQKKETVDIIRMSSTLMAGDLIKLQNIEKFPILRETYETLGRVERVDSNGNRRLHQVMIPWAASTEIVGQYMSDTVRAGSFLSVESITSEVVLRNPWIRDMQPDDEVYTMNFVNAKDVNMRLVYPGTSFRIRAVVSVPATEADSLRAKIKKAEEEALADGTHGTTMNIIKESTVISHGTSVGTSDILTKEEEVPVAEIIIERLTVTDLLNSQGESIYELYMALLKLPVSARIPYLQTTIGSEDIAKEWQSRVTPVSMVLAVDRESASYLAEFENNSRVKLKFTILPDLDETGLMSQFKEISSQIGTELSVGINGG